MMASALIQAVEIRKTTLFLQKPRLKSIKVNWNFHVSCYIVKETGR